MKSVAFLIFYILVQHLVSPQKVNETTVEETPEEASPTVADSDSDTVKLSNGSRDEGIPTDGPGDESNLTTDSTREDDYNTTDDGARNASATPSNNGTQKPTATQPTVLIDNLPKNATAKPKMSAAVTYPSVSSTVHTTAVAPGSSGAGYLVLLILLFVIIFFLFLIYFLHKKSKRYSFDLHHKVGEDASIPLNTVDQEGSFQPTLPKEDSPTSVQSVQEDNIPNNITVGSTPNVSTSETTGPIDDHDNGNLEKPVSEDSFDSQVPLSPKDGLGTLDLNDIHINLNGSNQTSEESLGEQPNENNNNMAAANTPGQESAEADPSKDFTEIQLDETA